jgi:H+/Cl- antiporter ClcA
VFFARIAGWSPVYTGALPAFEASGGVLLLVVFVGVLTGGLGIAYTRLYRWMAHLFGRNRRKGQVLRLLIGMLLSTAIGLSINPELLGTALPLVDRLVTGDLFFVSGLLMQVSLPVALALLLVAKIVTNCLTVASGMSAGFAGPAIIVGMLAGAIAAVLSGTVPGTATYSILIVAGLSGMLASMMNTPLAAAILAMEIFDTAYGIPAGLAAMIGFQTARYNTIYEAALDSE